CLQGYSSLSSF
nr:immunoglobulin light chain junction region [Macaca mulatta]